MEGAGMILQRMPVIERRDSPDIRCEGAGDLVRTMLISKNGRRVQSALF